MVYALCNVACLVGTVEQGKVKFNVFSDIPRYSCEGVRDDTLKFESQRLQLHITYLFLQLFLFLFCLFFFSQISTIISHIVTIIFSLFMYSWYGVG